jgi:acyl carrier protein
MIGASYSKMNTNDIEREIRGFLVERFLFGRDEALREDGSLLGSVIDSTGLIELVIFLQEHFGITVEDEEVIPENLDSVKSVVAYVARKLHSKA